MFGETVDLHLVGGLFKMSSYSALVFGFSFSVKHSMSKDNAFFTANFGNKEESVFRPSSVDLSFYFVTF